MQRLATVVCLVMVLAVAAGLTGCSKGEFVGSQMTGVYHTKTCIWAEEMSRENRVWFETAEEAEADEYTPCETCLPDRQ